MLNMLMKSRFDTRLQFLRLELTLCIKHVKIEHINAESMIYYDVNVFNIL